MGTTDATTAVGTILEVFREGLRKHPDQVLVRTKDDEVSWTWREAADRIAALAGGPPPADVKVFLAGAGREA